MKKIIFILLVLVPTFVFAQERKTYSGVYVYRGVRGTVVYEYIETNNGRVYDGFFEFNSGSRHDKGYFVRGVKNGEWITGQHKKTFNNGRLNGVIEHELRSFRYSPGIQQARVQYKDNRFTGDFFIRYGGANSNITFTGQFDSNGLAHGDWINCCPTDDWGLPFRRTQKWEHGYLVSDVAYYEATGRSFDLLRNSGDDRHWHIDRRNEEYVTEADGKTYRVAPFRRNNILAYDVRRHHPLVSPSRGYYFDYNPWSNHFPSRNSTGAYPMTVFPFVGIKAPLTRQEQQQLDERRQREMERVREREEREQQRIREQREREITRAINDFDNSTFGQILIGIRVKMNDGKTFEEARQEVVFSTMIAPLLVPQFAGATGGATNTTFGMPPRLGIPLQVGYNPVRNNFGVSKHILIIDVGRGWVTGGTANKGTITFQNINSIDFHSPNVFYQSNGLVVGLDRNNNFYIAQKKGNKIGKSKRMKPLNAQINTQSASSLGSLRRGIYYRIELSSHEYADIEEFLQTITLEEVNTPTRTRVDGTIEVDHRGRRAR